MPTGMALNAAIDLLLALATNAGQISAAIQEAQSAGQTELTPAQWATITGNDDAAIAQLEAAIKAAKTASPHTAAT